LESTIFICAAATKEFVDAHPEEIGKIQKAFARATKSIQDEATAESARDSVQKNFFSAMDPTLFKLSYASAAPGYLPGTVSKVGFDSLIDIQANVTGKDYSSVKFSDAVAEVAQGK